MEVKNFWLNEKEVFTEEILNELDKYNLDYLLIKEKNYNEIHFGECIIRLGDKNFVESIGSSIEFDKKMKEIEEACTDPNPEHDLLDKRLEEIHAKMKIIPELKKTSKI